MTDDERIILQKEKEELQDTINKLIQDFESKYVFKGVQVSLKVLTSQQEMNANRGKIKIDTITGLYITNRKK